MTKPKPKGKAPTREEQVAAALHPGPGALTDGTLALRSLLFALATSGKGKPMTYGAQAKESKGRS